MTIKKIYNAITGAIREVTRPENMQKIGDRLLIDIKQRTVEGKQADGRDFKRLKSSTIKKRRRLARKGGLSSDTRPEKSNQVMTGDMLKDTKAKSKTAKVTLGPTSRKNKKKLRGNQDLGRNYLEVSDKNLEDIGKDIAATIVASITSRLK